MPSTARHRATPTAQEPNHGLPASVLDRADDILHAVTGGEALTLAEIVECTGLPRSSVHRLLERMVRMGWLCRTGYRYHMGSRVFELGTAGVRTHWFHRTALPLLEQLHRQTRLNVHLTYLSDMHVVCWDRVAGVSGFPDPVRLGTRAPAHRTAAGKALLAGLPDEELSRLRDRHPDLPAGPAAAVRDWDELHAQLERVRLDGYATDMGELVGPLGGIGAAIQGPERSYAAVSVIGRSHQISTMPSLPGSVMQVAARLTRVVVAQGDHQ